MCKTNQNFEKKKSKKKQILVNALIIKVCNDNNSVPCGAGGFNETTSDNCVTRVAKVLAAL